MGTSAGLLGLGALREIGRDDSLAEELNQQRVISETEGEKLRNLGNVVVSPNGPEDGGDFGPKTEGTKTAGIQEAIEYAKANRRDVYIVGGPIPDHGKNPVVYNLQDTLQIPWQQDFRIDGGTYIINFWPPDGEKEKDAVQIDSQMNSKIRLSMVVSGVADAAVRIKPKTIGPDHLKIVTVTDFDLDLALAFPNLGVHPDERPSNEAQGDGLVLDSSEGVILKNRIFMAETNVQGTGIKLDDDNGNGRGVWQNKIENTFINLGHAAGPADGIQIGTPAESTKVGQNQINSYSASSPRGTYFDEEENRWTHPEGFVPPEGSRGVTIHGRQNWVSFNDVGRKRAEGTSVIFEKSATQNLVRAFNLPFGVTNNGDPPTNRIVRLDSVGFSVDTPSVPASGETVQNAEPYPVDVYVTDPGQTDGWSIVDANGESTTVSPAGGRVNGLVVPPGLLATLQPGEAIGFTYSARGAPSWTWKAAE